MKLLLLLLIVSFPLFAQNKEVLKVTYPEKYQAEAARFTSNYYVLAQAVKRNVTCIAAFKYPKELIWEAGTCRIGNHRVGFDLPLQIKGNKVYVVLNKRLQIRELATGKILKQTRIYFKGSDRRNRNFNANDSIFITGKYIIVKDRYTKFWVYNRNLKLVYESDAFSTGHYPSFSKGKFFIGYRIYEADFKKYTELPIYRNNTFKCHADSIEVRGNLALYATSCNLLLVDYVKRKTKLNVPMGHSQKAFYLTSRELAVLNKVPKEIKLLNRRTGSVYFNQAVSTGGIYKVARWFENEPAMLVNRVSPGARIYDSFGNLREVFKFESEKSFVQHFDMLGDAREEIIMHDKNGFAVFSGTEAFTKVFANRIKPRENFSLYSY